MEQKTQKKSKVVYFTLVGISTAILLVTPVLILMGIGFFLDKVFNTGYIFLIIGGIAGFVGGMYNIYKLLTKVK